MQVEPPHTNITVADSRQFWPILATPAVAFAAPACCHFAAKIIVDEVNHAVLPEIKYILVAFQQR
jgi:hypothetical protein